MGPHPGKRKIISLPQARATPIAPPAASTPIPRNPAAQPTAKEARREREHKRHVALTWLATAYPDLFGVEAKPLAIGVGLLLWPQAKAAGITRRALNAALRWRANSIDYLNALIHHGATRCNLNGDPVEQVSDEHRKRALEMRAELEQSQREQTQARKGPRP